MWSIGRTLENAVRGTVPGVGSTASGWQRPTGNQLRVDEKSAGFDERDRTLGGKTANQNANMRI
jgi:hypothetical protein